MKKIYLAVFAVLAISMPLSAQLTLTKAANSPVAGDVINLKDYDTTGVVPKNTGLAQTWNFSAFTSTQPAYPETYTTTASTPASSLFPSADLVRTSGGTEVEFLNVGGSNYEYLGSYKSSGPEIMNFTNTAVMLAWPVASTNTFSDAVSGAITSGTNVMPVTGMISYTASGTGTVIMPGGITYSNCLQVKQTVSLTIGTGSTATNYSHVNYLYYSSQTKFPVADIMYEKEVGQSGTTNRFRMTLNQAGLPAGMNEINKTGAQVLVYPNPANEMVTISSSSPIERLEILDINGRIVKEAELSSSINVKGIAPSVYTVRIQTKEGIATKRLVIK